MDHSHRQFRRYAVDPFSEARAFGQHAAYRDQQQQRGQGLHAPAGRAELDFRLDSDGQLLGMRSQLNTLETINIERDGEDFTFSKDVLEPEVRTRYASGTINSSLFMAAQNAGLSHNLTMQMANVFGYDVDFAREIRQGDQFEVLY